MACKACRKRRQKMADAYRQEGVKGALKALPAVVRDTIQHPPHIRLRTVHRG